MTNREFFAKVSAGEMNDEIMAHAVSAIEKMDAANEKRKNTPSKTAEANAPLVEAIITGILTHEPITGVEIADKLNEMFPELEKPVTVNKVASLLKNAVAALQSNLDLPDGMEDSGVVAVEFPSDFRQTQIGHLTDQIHGNLTCFRSTLIFQRTS